MSRVWPILLLALILTGCGESSERKGTTGSAQKPEKKAVSATQFNLETTQKRAATTVSKNEPDSAYGYTYGQASGNHVVEGTGSLPESEPVDVQLDGVPVWVAGVALEDDTAWVATLEDGSVQAFRLDESGQAESMPISPNRLAPGQPPLVEARGDSLGLVTSRYEAASELAHPVPVSPDGGEQIGVEAGGSVYEEVSDGDSVGIGETGVSALPDARFVQGSGGTLSFLSAPTERYDHGVLGDAIEADSMTLLYPDEREDFKAETVFPASGGVFEQISPLWFEMQGVNGELLAVTESTPELATRVSVYNLDGSLVAAGPFIGEPYKWRHLIAAGPFGPNGEIELVDTLTPHIGGTIEFYKPDLDSGSLDIVATQTGYTSHRIYTRNMDTARAGDLDGDDRWELLVPNNIYTELGAIRRTQDGSEVAWTLPADGTIVTNLASATNSEGRAQIGVGRQDGVLRIWP